VERAQDTFSFGHVVTDNSQELQFLLVNTGAIDSVVFLNLNPFPDFHPSLTSDGHLSSLLDSDNMAEDGEGNIMEYVKHAEENLLWKFSVFAEYTCHCYLLFAPQNAKVWDFVCFP
jgi:hypothetical protein